MAIPPSLCIEKLKQALDYADVGQHPVEVHGALVGLICGGVKQENFAWLTPLVELMNDGQPLEANLQKLISELYQDTVTRLVDFEFGFTLLLPEEEVPLSERVEALALWTQSFLTGIAIIQPQLAKASSDVREVIKDLADIAQVEFDVGDDEESEVAYVELQEFVRMSAILCYSEFGLDMPLHDTDEHSNFH
jgi:uncharacterized protein YgfB (UPF0149 family)